MKLGRYLLVGIILLILTTNFCSFTNSYKNPSTNTEGKIISIASNNFLMPFNSDPFIHSVYEPRDINLRDTAYHKSYDKLHVEWWFYEGIFDNGYSIAFFIMMMSKENTLINEPLASCVFWLTLYKDTNLKFFSIKEFPYENLNASEEFPFIKMSDEQNFVLMTLDQESYKNKQWIFNVSFRVDDQGTKLASNLTFTGTTKGYAGETLGGWYGPILPKASVVGNLTLNNEKMAVSGLGYLEHGWEIPLPVWEYGWFFGKIVSDSYCLFWGKMMQTRWIEEGRAAIFSKDGSGYITLNPNNFIFTPTKFRFNNGELIPTKFIFYLSEPGICINVTMETLNINHFTSTAGLSNTWRYHVLVNGHITYKNTVEIIKDEIQMMGITRFR